jgi:hypothetical protein
MYICIYICVYMYYIYMYIYICIKICIYVYKYINNICRFGSLVHTVQDEMNLDIKFVVDIDNFVINYGMSNHALYY